jgi:hypothetical protein
MAEERVEIPQCWFMLTNKDEVCLCFRACMRLCVYVCVTSFFGYSDDGGEDRDTSVLIYVEK